MPSLFPRREHRRVSTCRGCAPVIWWSGSASTPGKMRHLLPAVFDFSAIGPYPPSPLQLAVAELAGRSWAWRPKPAQARPRQRSGASPTRLPTAWWTGFISPCRRAVLRLPSMPAFKPHATACWGRAAGRGALSLPVTPAAPAAGLRRPMDGRPRRGHKALPLGRREAEALSRRASGVGHH